MTQPPSPPPDPNRPAGETGDQPAYGQPGYGSTGDRPTSWSQPDQPGETSPTYGPAPGQPPGQPDQPYGSDYHQPGWSQPSAAQYGSDIRRTEAGYAQMYGQKPRTGLAVAALVLGIVGLLLCWIPVVGSILAILALIFGIVAVRRPAGRGMATTGIVLGALALVLSVLLAIFWVRVGADAVQIIEECVDETGTNQGPVFDQCVQDRSENFNPFD